MIVLSCVHNSPPRRLIGLTLVEVELLLREHHDGPEEGDEADLDDGEGSGTVIIVLKAWTEAAGLTCCQHLNCHIVVTHHDEGAIWIEALLEVQPGDQEPRHSCLLMTTSGSTGRVEDLIE